MTALHVDLIAPPDLDRDVARWELQHALAGVDVIQGMDAWGKQPARYHAAKDVRMNPIMMLQVLHSSSRTVNRRKVISICDKTSQVEVV